MRTVWKYEVAVSDRPTAHEVPAGAVFLPVADCPGHGRSVFVWALVDNNADREPRWLSIRGTGFAAPVDGQYVATAIWRTASVGPFGDGSLSSPLVWHVFEVTT